MSGRGGGTRERVLPPALRVPLGVAAGLAGLVVLALGLRYAGDGGPGRVDGWLVPSTADSVRPPWRYAALAVDFLGEPGGAAVLMVTALAGCLLLRRPRAAVFLLAATGLTVATTTLLKHLVGRTIHGAGNLSFPSGHTAFATTLALVAALLVAGRRGLGRAAGTLLVLDAGLAAGLAMGWAEVALGAHYATDALGGWCTALAVVHATAWLIDRAAERGAARPGTGSATRPESGTAARGVAGRSRHGRGV
jgi:undecaprenyl-diphosphatase